MSKQRHDIGHRKRKTAQARQNTRTSTNALAQILVARGIRSEQILDSGTRRPRRDDAAQ